MPLTYNPNRVVIVCASSPGRLAEECASYNVDPAAPGLKIVYTSDDLPAVLNLPVETPWCVVGGTGWGAREALKTRYGGEKTFAAAIYVVEEDIAWRKPVTDRI